MNTLQSETNDVTAAAATHGCLVQAGILGQFYHAQAEDILTDDDLLDLFRIVKQILRKKPDTDRVAKLLFCVSYALGDSVKFSKAIHDDRIVFRDCNHHMGTVVLPPGTSATCCNGGGVVVSNNSNNNNNNNNHNNATAHTVMSASSNSSSSISSYPQQQQQQQQQEDDQWSSSTSPLSRLFSSSGIDTPVTENASTESFRSYTQFPTPPSQSSSSSQHHHHHQPQPQPQLQPTTPQHQQPQQLTQQQQEDPMQKYPYLRTLLSNALTGNANEVLMEPKQRGFYYQDGQIAREPALLQRYAEQGVLTQASLMRKRKRQLPDFNFPYELATLPAPAKKSKMPHRHGEFEQRRDEIISRMRSITLSDLEQKAQRLTDDFSLAIEYAPEVTADPDRTPEEAADLLEPALRILTIHSNMKPHLDNGMNQNGIYYNADYFRLYLAFEQFQSRFALLYPNEVVKLNEEQQQLQQEQQQQQQQNDTMSNSSIIVANAADRDRERNANMKAYRGWVEPLLTETNWAAFRRNIVVGERMKQLTQVVGQGMLLMTKELSGSKLHLTFTNNEWEEFINGLSEGKWDHTIKWDSEPLAMRGKDGESMLVTELQRKFGTQHWFGADGKVTSQDQRRVSLRNSARQSVDSPSLSASSSSSPVVEDNHQRQNQ
ncbi:hypothetical protein BDB00DRAFT_808421 [Zychaea mexicana]|uniref:uncharacterized protein n=1 Tax=Zychaea mexicana TaxID=64656 RepID=UPI0022FDB57E|nr:uncharacterized protein BDB00DRAFT_808421 [Zychaea mexicana]KAI9496703.1 hypothetical protein BDB00DRAFT_808421 [Zychaea mexicana]